MGTPLADRSPGAIGGAIGGAIDGLRPRLDDLPVVEPLQPLFPSGSLARGRVLQCQGPAATSLGAALVARATQIGSWVAVIGVPAMGVEAFREAEVALERLVAVDAGHAREWAERVAAAADGFDLILTQLPDRVPDRLMRSVRQRLQAKGVVLITIDPPARSGASAVAGVAGTDLCVSSSSESWEGPVQGGGHLRRRRLTVTVSGRRAPRPLTAEYWLPGASGGIEAVVPAAGAFIEPVVEPASESA